VLWGHLALTVAALFTGAAFYINFAEQPARLTLNDAALLAEWKPAYKRGYVMQATLAVLGFLLGFAAWWTTGRLGFLMGALLMIANWPWTIFAMLPTNNALMTTQLDFAGRSTRALIVKWNALHAVRTALGASAILAFVLAFS
jgi:hypothetical protein